MNLPRLVTISACALSSLASVASAVPVISEVIASPAPTAGGSTVVVRGTGLGAVSTVSIGGSSAPITLATSGYIFCIAPAGQGRNVSVQVFEGPTPSNTVNTFAYDIPRVSNLNVNVSSTPGGGILTITGSNFGISRTVTIGGTLAIPTGANSHTQIQVTIPAGQGTNLPVVINCNGQTNLASETPSFSYNAPFVNTLTSNGFTTAGGTATLSGTNFGVSPQVLVNGVAATLSGTPTHTSITFNVPPGSGTNIPVIVNVAGQTSNIQALSYPVPTITSPSPASGSTAGGYELTINGQNLGPAAAASISFNGQTVPALNSSPGHTLLRFIVPAGQGAARSLSVTTGGQSSAGNTAFSYSSPLITNVFPAALAANQSQTITVLGNSFGTSSTLIINGNTVPILNQTHTSITASAPPLPSGIASIQVFTQAQSSNIVPVSVICPADFNEDGSVDFFDYLDFVAAFSTPC
jgi:hypothetical protein